MSKGTEVHIIAVLWFIVGSIELGNGNLAVSIMFKSLAVVLLFVACYISIEGK